MRFLDTVRRNQAGIARFADSLGVNAVTTAIFATCGMNVFVFLIAAILSSPKQFITVYLGVLLQESGTGMPKFLLAPYRIRSTFDD